MQAPPGNLVEIYCPTTQVIRSQWDVEVNSGLFFQPKCCFTGNGCCRKIEFWFQPLSFLVWNSSFEILKQSFQILKFNSSNLKLILSTMKCTMMVHLHFQTKKFKSTSEKTCWKIK